MSTRAVLLGVASALALSASLLSASPALADDVAGSLSSLGCVGVSGSTSNGPAPCGTELPASLTNVYQAVVSPDGQNVYEALLGNEIAEFSRDPSTGVLTPLLTPNDCIAAPDGGLTDDQCAQQTASGLNGVAALAISPDGQNVYAIGQGDNAVVEFQRDPTTGALTQLGGTDACIGEPSAGSSCDNQTGYALDNADGITVSPDGLNVYVASYGDHAIAEFHRDPSTGALTEFACESDSTYTSGNCTGTADGLENAIGVAVSPDGQDVYVAAGGTGDSGGDIAEFSRDTGVPTDSPDYGELTQLPYPDDCITSVGNLDGNVQCGDTSAVGVSGPEDLVLSPDGRSLYANSFNDNAVLEFSRDPTTGALSQLAAPNDCISSTDASGCGITDVPSLSGPLGVAVSPDGFDLYVADSGSSSVTTLQRDPVSGALSPLASPDDCITVSDGGCGTDDVPGLTGARWLTVSPDGENLYVAAQDAPAVVELTRTLPQADLGLSESRAPSAAGVNATVAHVYTIANAGPADADDPVLSVHLSAGTTLDWASGSQGTCAGTGTVVCDIGLLRAGDSATVTVKVDLASAGPATASATVNDATDVADPDLDDNTVVTTTEVGMGTGTGVYVTQRDSGASANVASLTLGSFDDELSAPALAGSGGAASFGIAVTPDGAHIYVTNDNGNSSISQYSVDPTTGTLTPLDPATVTVSQAAGSEPEDIAVDPTGRWAYVANLAGGSVSQLRIDQSTGALTMVNEFQSSASPALTLTSPTGVTFSPDGQSLYVADYGAGDIAEFSVDPLTGTITPKSTPTVPLPQPNLSITPAPRRLVTASIGGNDYLYASDAADDQIVEFSIDPSSGELSVAGAVPSDADPTGLAVDTSSTPASLYVAAEESGVVDEYDIDPGSGALAAKASASIPAGADPDGVALAPDGQELYVGDSGDQYLNLYTIAADGTLADDPTPQIAVGGGPSTPVVHALPAPPVAPPTPIGGALTQLAAPNDCVTGNELGSTGVPIGCSTLIAPSLDADYQTVVSPDGKNVYAAAWLGWLVEFSRDPATGALTEIGCVSDGSSPCATDNASGSNNPRALTLSPDGAYLYEVTSEDAIVTFSRDPSSGLLTWLGCLSPDDSSCTQASGLNGPNGVAISPDGTSAYVTSGDDSSVAWFSRDPSTGMLTQSSPSDCISSDSSNPAGCAVDTANGLTNPVGVAVSPDGENVYVSAGGLGPGDVAELSRDPSTGALTQLASPNDCMTSSGTGIDCGDMSATGFNGEEDIAISPDGRSLYLNSFDDSAVIELRRDPSNGVLTQMSWPNNCITSDTTNPGGCGTTDAVALNGVQGVAVSPDGLNVYASSSGPIAPTGASNAIDELQRNPVTGALTQAAAPFDCLTENGSGCSSYNDNGLGQVRRLTVSPDGLNVYAVGQEGTLVELSRTPPSADLSIEESGAPAKAAVGDSITYTYTVDDGGPSDVDDPVVTVPLASGETFTSATSSQGSCTGTATVECDLGPLLDGTSATVNVTVSATTSGTASVDASVADATDVTDAQLANNDVGTATDVADASPQLLQAPAIGGDATEGGTLAVSEGTWTGSPGTFDYDWEDCSDDTATNCTTVQDGANDEYLLGVSDEGQWVQVIVTATNGSGSNSATTTVTGPVTGPPVGVLPAPAISGPVTEGGTLTVSSGGWDGYPAPSFDYDWEDCSSSSLLSCSSVQDGSSDQYSPGVADEGMMIEVVVTASNNVGADGVAMTAMTAPVTGPPVGVLPAPAISGPVTEGGTLTVSSGGWDGYPAPSFDYDWEDCSSSSLLSCSSVQDGSSDQYSLGVGDEGMMVEVVVTASNNVGADGVAMTAMTSAVTGPPVGVSPQPAISGPVTQGATLTVSSGGWHGYPAPSFDYDWEDCSSSSLLSCSSVQDGSSDQYSPGVADEGMMIEVVVTASNNVGADGVAMTAMTAPVTGPPVGVLPAPAISGPVTEGGTLTVSSGGWDGYPAPSFDYDWEDCSSSSLLSCSSVQDGSSDQYSLGVGDEGMMVEVVVTASNNVGADGVAMTAMTAPVTGPPVGVSPQPAISGSATDGQTLTASSGGWTGYPLPSFTYAWQDCASSSPSSCSTVQSGNSDQYTVGVGDEGMMIRVVVTASNHIGSPGTAATAMTGGVTGPPAVLSGPAIGGSVTQGQTLTASPGSWDGYPAPSFDYDWEDCSSSSLSSCSSVQDGNSNQYTLVSGDEGMMVRVVVTASNGIGTAGTAATSMTARVTESPANTAPPTVGAGVVQQGQPLTGAAGTWSGYPAPTLTYQWEQCNSSGGGCAPVAANGNALSYTPTSADVGQTLVFQVTATNSVSTQTAESSPTTAVLIAAPANTALPTVSGTAQQGDVLTAGTGSWSNSPTSFTYQWLQCNSLGGSCNQIAGAVASSYVAAGGDVGNTLRVTVTADNDGGSSVATSGQSAVVLIEAPANTVLPAISGPAGQGQQLTTSNGVWADSPIGFTYQWQQCDSSGNNCNNIGGATASNYVTQPGDLGHTLRAIVTASNGGGQTAATSAPSSVVGTLPVDTAAPIVSGTAQEGTTLTTTDGTWTGTPAPTFTYQWQQCDSSGNNCAVIPGATASSYVPTDSDVGQTLRVVVTAASTSGSSAAPSTPTAVVLAGAPGNSTPPVISGTAQPGQTLSASTGTWTSSPGSFAYQWQRCDSTGNNCTAISGATSSSYVVAPGDAGYTLSVVVTASTNAGSGSATSAPSQVVSSTPPGNTGAPVISGEAQQGQALTSSPGSWTNSPSSFAYQWQQCDGSGNNCAAIPGANGSSYVAAAADVGHTLRVTVTAGNSSGDNAATSAQTAAVLMAAPANSAPPAISGTAQQGDELSLSKGSWLNAPTSFSYQWLRCNKIGSDCSAISGATGNKYVPAAADGGHTLRASVTAFNPGGSNSAESSQSAVVGGLQVSVASPILGKTSEAGPVSGTVLVRLPGSSTFTRLKSTTDVPLGSTIDTRSGRVTLTVALPHGGSQTGQFYDGEFVLTQTAMGTTILTLAGGSFAACPAPTPAGSTNGASTNGGSTSGGATASVAHDKPTTVIRQLWGNAHGNYTTKGRYGSAAVSGTIWLTQDRCDGTYVTVTKDNVFVVAYAHPRQKHNIKQGHHILIPAPGF